MNKIILLILITFTLSMSATSIYRYVDIGVGTGNISAGDSWATAWGSIDTALTYAVNNATAGVAVIVRGSTTTDTIRSAYNWSANDATGTNMFKIIGVKIGTTHEDTNITQSDFAFDSVDMPKIYSANSITFGDYTLFQGLNFILDVPSAGSFVANNNCIISNCIFTTNNTVTASRSIFAGNGVLTRNKFNCNFVRVFNTSGASQFSYNTVIGDGSLNNYGVVIGGTNLISKFNKYIGLRYGIYNNSMSTNRNDHDLFYSCSTGIHYAGVVSSAVITDCGFVNNVKYDVYVETAFDNMYVNANGFATTPKVNNYPNGLVGDINQIVGDPLFTNAAAGDFSLQLGSAWINKGTKAP